MQPRLQPSEARAPKKSVKGGRASWRISESSWSREIGNETVQPDNPQTRGKIAKIGYLLKVTEE